MSARPRWFVEDAVTDTIRVDLHTHSSMSDGDHSPSYVAHSIAATGAVWAALTDHNCVKGQALFRSALDKRGVRCVAGVEIDARSPIGPLHLLGFGFHLENEPLLEALRTIKQPWRASVLRWAARVRALGGRPAAAPRPCAPSDEDSSQHHPPGTEETICLIHQAGGRVFLAHPLAGLESIERLEEILDWLQPQGLDGLEAFHKQYPPMTQDALLEVAERRGLLTVGGSDFHGVHHSDGGMPGVDMPLIHLNRFLTAIGVAEADISSTLYQDRPATILRGYLGQ